MKYDELNLGYLRDYINKIYQLKNYLIIDCIVDYDSDVIKVYLSDEIYRIEIPIVDYDKYLRYDKLNKIKNKIYERRRNII